MKQLGTALFVAMVMSAGVTCGKEPAFELKEPGAAYVDYQKFGRFEEVGTPGFHYVTTNRDGLAEASGWGVDPNRTVYEDPEYLAAEDAGKLDADWWKHVASFDSQLDFFVWLNAGEEPGVRQFYIGKVLERAGHPRQAIKAYRACMILYPESVSWSASGEYAWSIAEGAWNRIMNITREHPDLGLELIDANVTVKTDESGHTVSVTPGKMISSLRATDESVGEEPEESEKLVDESVQPEAPLEIETVRGEGTVTLVKYTNGDWRMCVDGEPWFVHGVVYDPTKVGVVPWEWDWMWADDNTNGIMDVRETWADLNGNNLRDEDEPVVGDFKLLADMGCNTIKTYAKDINIYLMRRMYHEHGIRVVVGDFAGAYCHDSGASWEEGTDYNSRDQKQRIKEAIRKRVEKLRNEPWLLAWILGNENNMPSTFVVNATRTNANKYPEAYARFLNDLAQMIHGLDPNHPVGVGNLMTGLVEYYRDYAPAIDFIGVNCYIGPDGFGSTWEKVKQTMDRPVLITEYGCDSYYTDRGPDEEGQADYHMGNWADIIYNRAGGPGSGNSIGGCLFEWVDEWWKDAKMKQVEGEWVFKDPLDHQNTEATGDMAFPDGKSQEEWLGIVGQGNGEASPFLRVPKKAYYAYKETWKREELTGKEDACEEEEDAVETVVADNENEREETIQ